MKGVCETEPCDSPHGENYRARARRHRLLPRIVIADDQAEVLETVKSLLKDEFQVVGLAEDGKRVISVVHALSPDVVILDIFMPELNGIETTLHLKQSGSTTKVIFLTVHDDPDFLAAALSTGAQGYVLKPHLATDLVPAVWEVLAGHTFVSHGLLAK